jgi:hypothetical protein
MSAQADAVTLSVCPCRAYVTRHDAVAICLVSQAMFLMAWRLTKLYEEGRMTHEQVRSDWTHEQLRMK